MGLWCVDRDYVTVMYLCLFGPFKSYNFFLKRIIRANYGYTKVVDSTEADPKPNLITLTSYIVHIQHSRYLLLKIVK